MATLAGFKGSDLFSGPSPLQGISDVIGGIIKERKEQEANEALSEILIEGVSGFDKTSAKQPGLPGQPGGQDLSRIVPGGVSSSLLKHLRVLGKLDPAKAQFAFNIIRTGQAEQIAKARAQVKKRGLIAIGLRNEKDPQKRAQMAVLFAESDPNQAGQMNELLKMSPESQEVFLDKSILEARSFDGVMASILKPIPTTEVNVGDEIQTSFVDPITLKRGRVSAPRFEQKAPVAPKSRTINVGDGLQQFQELNPATNKFENVGNPFEAGEKGPREQEQILEARRTRTPLVQITPFEEEGQKLGARSDAAVRDEIRGNARTSSRKLSTVRNLSKLLKKAKTGALTQFFPQIGRLLPGFDATDEQAASAQINTLVLEQMQAFKGSTSNRELDFATQTIQQLGNTPEANAIITRSLENVIFLAQQENNQFDAFVKEGKKPRDFIFNFQKTLFQNHPKFGDVTLDDIQTTAFENGISMEEAINEMRKR